MHGPPDDHEPPLRVMALHALLYCPRLFYLEEVEGIRIADDRVYAGRELHAGLEDEEGDTCQTLDLTSPRLGLRGRVDVLRRRSGATIPYEHKRGRCRRGEDRQPEAWPSDQVQAAAYAMMLEEALGRQVSEARVRYHADGVTVRVPIDDQMRSRVHHAIDEARTLRQSTQRPPVAANENLCTRCSLAPVCLPEEVRHLADPQRPARRLFPPDQQRTTLHVLSHGARVGRSSSQLVVTPREGEPSHHPARQTGAVLVHGHAQISTQAIRLCADEEIAVFWMTATGRAIAALAPAAGQVQRRLRQYEALSRPVTCLELARRLVQARVEGQHRYLLRATRQDQDARQRILPHLRAIGQALQAIGAATETDRLRGHEGQAATHYWACFNDLLAASVPEQLRFAGRSRRPPTDRLSALLNFGYGLLYTAVMRGVLAAGLEPALGFYHTPRSQAHPLVLDLMEIFRVPLWDLVVIGSLNRGQWDPEQDFTVSPGMTWLSDAGRRKAIGLFEDRLQESWKHPVLDYSLSYARTIELEARLLEKEWSGEPGLFARLRLR